MRVTHVIPGDLWAGAETQVYFTLLELSSEPDLDVNIILFNKKELYKNLFEKGIDIHYMDEAEHNGISLMLWMKEIFNKERPDIIHAHGYKSHILASFSNYLSGHSGKLVRTIHGQMPPLLGKKYIKLLPLLILEDLLLRYSTKSIIAVSQDIEYALNVRFKNTNIQYIRNSVSLPANNKEQDIRPKYDINKNEFWIATAVRLVPIKNLAMLLDVASVLLDSGMSNIKVSVFGGGPLMKELTMQVKQKKLEGFVKFHGHTENILECFKAIDVFVLTSYSEGLPMSLLEAMSCGVVPVCTDVGGIKEVITDKVCGYLVKPDNSQKMAEIIITLINNAELKKNIGIKARERIKRDFAIEKSVGDLLTVYQE